MRALGSGAESSCSVLPPRQRRELLRHCLGKTVVVQVSGRGKHHVPAVKAVVVVGEELLLAQPRDGFRGAQDRLAQRMALPEALREEFVHQHVGIVFVDLDLFQNHAALALDVGQRKGGVQHQVGQDVQRDRHVVCERLDVEADGLLAGEGVQVAADRIHLARNALRRARTRALEEHVLHKMRDTVDLRGFAARARLDPDAHGHGAQIIHALGQDDQAVRQYGAAKVSLSVHRHPVELRL